MKRKLLLTMLFVASAIGFNANAQTDVTSTYLTNADFEGSYESYAKPQADRDIYKPAGWNITYTNGESNDLTSLNGDCSQWSNFSGRLQPSNGENNTYWVRFRWGESELLTLSQETKVALPVGVYRLSADAYFNNSNATVSINVAGKTITANRNAWANYAIFFTVTESAKVTISFSIKQNSQVETVAGFDNFKLETFTQGVSDISAQDWTSMIANAGFESGSGSHSGGTVTTPYGYTMEQTMDGWKDGSINTTNPSEGSNLYNYWAGTTTSLDIYQRLQLPAGKYTITADLRTEAGKISNQGVYAKIGDETFKSGTITNTTDPFNSVEAWNTLSKDFYVQSDGTVQVGASSTGGASSLGWFQIDNFTLKYYGAIANTPYSIVPEVATAATADTWYAVNITASGEYKIISSVDNTIKYTQSGSLIPSEVATTLNMTADEKQVVNLTAGTLWVLASSAATLTVAPNVYTYNVGDGTTSLANNEYTQLNTMTVTFADASTNDPAGEFQILDASKITVNGAAATASVTGNVLTITLADPLLVSTDYAISIAAGAVGYKADAANDEITLTAHTPDLFDGTYFISDGTKYISRGGDSNTEAVLDEYGIAATFSTNASNVTTIVFVDNNKNLFGGSTSIYTDKNYSDLEGEGAGKGQRIYWTISKVTGGYKFYNNNSDKYIKWGTSVEDTHAYAAIYATDAEDAGIWTLVAPAAHAATMATYKDVNATAVATAAGLSAATVTELKAIIEGAEWTSKNITVTDAITSVQEKYQFADSETPFSENLTGLENGIYKVKLSVFKRIAGNDDTYDLYNKNQDSPTAYLFAGDNKAQVPSVMSEYSTEAYTGGWGPNWAKDGKNYPNNTTNAGQAFDAGRYTLEVFAYVSDGTLNIGLKNPAKYANSNWLCYRDLKVTYYQNNGPVTISEDVNYTPTAMTAYVTLNRTIKADTWNTFVVPFAINNTDLKAAFGADVAVAEYSEVADGDNSTVSFTTMATPAVAANTPVLLKTSTAGTSYIFPARTIVAGEAKKTGTNFDFVGNYNASLALVNGDYFISSNNLYKKGEGSTVTLKGTRAYIMPKSSSVKILNFVIDDEIVTGVDSVEAAEAEEEGVLYNTAGQVVTEEYKGIVIKNGKKYYQK